MAVIIIELTSEFSFAQLIQASNVVGKFVCFRSIWPSTKVGLVYSRMSGNIERQRRKFVMSSCVSTFYKYCRLVE